MLPIKDDIPTRRFPIVTVAIIAINLFVFFGLQVTGVSLDGAQLKDEFVTKYAAVPYEITHPGKQCGTVGVLPGGEELPARQGLVCEGERILAETPLGSVESVEPVDVVPRDQPPAWATVLFAMFMHGGLLHLGGNMLFLWIFGNNIEDSMNRLAFVLFYLAGGIVATLAQTLLNPDSAVPTLGASGAIAAVLGGYAMLYPRARVLTLVFIVFFVTVLRLPALLVLGVWLLLQFLGFSTVEEAGGGGVAYLAHIGGFIFGLVVIKLFATRRQDDYERSHRLPVY